MASLGLPIELLLEVFKDATTGGNIDEDAKTAFRLAGVCKRWRALLLNCGPVWAVLSLSQRETTRLMLERSDGAPLVVRVKLSGVRGYREHMSNAVFILEQAPGRIRELSISADDYHGYTGRVVEKFSGQAATSLNTLELTSIKSASLAAFKLTPANLSGTIPLHRLTLHNTTFFDGSDTLLRNHCTNLAHLELRAVRLSLVALLDVLAAARDTLITIKLDSFVPISTPEPQLQEPINLAALEELVLDGLTTFSGSTASTDLLRYINRPSTSRLSMIIHAYDRPAAVSAALNALNAHLASTGYNLRSALLSPVESPPSTSAQRQGIRLRCWTSRAIPDVYNIDEHSPAVLDLSVIRVGSRSPDVDVRVLASLARSANLASVRKVAVAPFEYRVPWARVAAEATQLNELSVYGPDNLRNLHHACCISKHQPVDGPDAPVYTHADLLPLEAPFLAHLTTLNVYALNLDALSPESDMHTLTSFLPTLPRPVEQLCICYCNMLSVDRNVIEPSMGGGTLVWDHCERGLDSVPAEDEVPATPPGMVRIPVGPVHPPAATLEFDQMPGLGAEDEVEDQGMMGFMDNDMDEAGEQAQMGMMPAPAVPWDMEMPMPGFQWLDPPGLGQNPPVQGGAQAGPAANVGELPDAFAHLPVVIVNHMPHLQHAAQGP
ncbi:unnamed protein product [Peniophora sp. CBMAI 1063]|nr:unnamed protein product [Peniophora sp. CBMAI 1063]